METIKKLFRLSLPILMCLSSCAFIKGDFQTIQNAEETYNATILNKTIEDRLQESTIETMSIEKIEKVSSSFEKLITKNIQRDQNGLVYIDEQFSNNTDLLFFACDEEEQIMANLYIDFVNSNIETMNTFISNGFGEMDDEGTFVFNENVYSSYEQQSPLVSSYKFNIFKGHTFVASSEFTVPFSIVGLIANIASVFTCILGNSKQSLNSIQGSGSNVSKLDNLFGSANTSSLLTAVHSGIAGFSINDCASILLNAISIILTALAFTPSIGWVVSLVLTLLTLYLPNITTSIQLFKNFATNRRVLMLI